jgi:hypothetical protein
MSLEILWMRCADGRTRMEELKSTCPLGGRYMIISNESCMKTLQKIGQWSTDTAEVVIEQSNVDFVANLCHGVQEFIPNLEIWTTIWLNGVLYLGAPMYAGAPWHDWVIVDWGDDGYLPSFVNLETLPQDNDIVCGGLSGIPPSVYAIVESAVQHRSSSSSGIKLEIFLGITKEVGGMQHNRDTKLKFYLVDVGAFHDPVVIIPDMGSRLPNRYLMLRNLRKWNEEFTKWLDAPVQNLSIKSEVCNNLTCMK